jgi:hypothetical protein
VKGLLLAGLSFVALTAGAEARVVGFEVTRTEAPAFAGRSFEAGSYEKIVARVTMAVKPEDAHNAGIVDLALAPRNAAGEVVFSTDVHILKPADPARGNGKLLYEVPNRGRKLGLSLLNDAPMVNDPASAADAGNGFLMDQGYTLVWSGWQGDLATAGGLLGLDVPTVPGVTGESREEFVFDDTKGTEGPVVAVDLSYPAADADPAKARLTVRAREGDARATPDGLSFKFLSPTRIEIIKAPGFDAGAIYEFIYTAKDPKVMGLGFAAVRDLVSFLRYERAAPDGSANPLAADGAPDLKAAYAIGISQSGRFLRDLLYQGFNDDESGRPVFDGLMPHIAGARRTFTNARFAQPGRYSRDHEDHLYPGDAFPFSYATSLDPIGGSTDGILKRCEAAGACPKVIQTDTDTEAVQARLSLVVTDTAGKPLALPANVRAYYFAGLPHFTPFGAKSTPVAACQLPSNPLHAGAPMRALLVALDAWVSEGREPPPSRYPGLEEGTLVAAQEAGYDGIPGLKFAGEHNEKSLVDHTRMPPVAGPAYPVFLPRVDADGHAVAGIRLPAIEAPTATYLGWNLRKAGFAEGAICGLTGSEIPLARTGAARQQAGDGRLSVEERYPDHAAYVAAVTTAARKLVGERLMLPADADTIVRAAEASDVAR